MVDTVYGSLCLYDHGYHPGSSVTEHMMINLRLSPGPSNFIVKLYLCINKYKYKQDCEFVFRICFYITFFVRSK